MKWRALGKQPKLMTIGQFRHHKMMMLLLARSLKSDNLFYWVGDVTEEGVDGCFSKATSPKTLQVLEAYEFTNYKQFNDLEEIKQKYLDKRQQRGDRIELLLSKGRSITLRFIDPCYHPNKAFVKVSKENVRNHIDHFIELSTYLGYDFEAYVVFSFWENLTEYAFWEYAKNGIRVKILGYQD